MYVSLAVLRFRGRFSGTREGSPHYDFKLKLKINPLRVNLQFFEGQNAKSRLINLSSECGEVFYQTLARNLALPHSLSFSFPLPIHQHSFPLTMSTSETAPLIPSRDLEAGDDPDLDFYNDSIQRMESSKHRNSSNSLCFRILYGISLSASASGLVIFMLAYTMIRTGPFDKDSKRRERAAYESDFLGRLSLVVFVCPKYIRTSGKIWLMKHLQLGVNALYTTLNLNMARKGRLDILVPLNMPYDLLMFASLIGFGILELIQVLWERRMCDGWDDDAKYRECDSEMFRLLVVEISAISFALLAG
jgi:hypothetical protein